MFFLKWVVLGVVFSEVGRFVGRFVGGFGPPKSTDEANDSFSDLIARRAVNEIYDTSENFI